MKSLRLNLRSALWTAWLLFFLGLSFLRLYRSKRKKA